MHPGSKYTYLALSDDLFHDGFYVIGGGMAHILPGQSYPPKGHPTLYDYQWNSERILPEFQIAIITSGLGEFQQRGQPLTQVSTGSIIVNFPGVWHRYRPIASIGWTEKWLQFNGEFAHILQERGLLSPKTPVLRSPRFEELDREFSQLLDLIHANPTSNSLSLSLHALAILSRLIGAIKENLARPPQPAIVKDPLVETALQFIWTSHHRTISVAAVAQHVGVNRRTLERRFFSETNQSVLDQIIQCRFNRAERLLRETKLSVKAIISLSGFGSEETMRKTFLKRTNQSPSAYRKCKISA